MEYNESLSARIGRRNKQGFLGYGNHFYFTNNVGDYKDVNQNNKKKNIYQSVINFLKRKGFRHSGSKNIKTLKQYM